MNATQQSQGAIERCGAAMTERTAVFLYGIANVTAPDVVP